jgi:3'-5' exoribonuclease
MAEKVKDLGKVKVQQLEKGAKAVLVGDFAKQIKSSSNGEYPLVRITDNTGTAFARVWSNLPIAPIVAELTDGDYVEVEVMCTNIGQFTNIDINKITKVERPIVTVVDIEGLKEELREVFKSFKDENLRNLVTAVFSREDVKELFFTSPASQQSGYSFDGGLLAHVVRTIRLCDAIADVFDNWNHNVDNFVSKLNRDLLKTASMLHDIGKVKAFAKKGHKVEKTIDGELFEDSYITMKIVLEELAKVSIPEEQKVVLEHVLGSSKGKQGYGALFIPRSREALAFHLIESLDVQMSNFEFLDRNAGAEQSFVQLFQKTMFLGSYDEE